MLDKQIFISYSRKDKPFASRIYQDLLSAGYPVWMDPEIEPVKKWKPQIESNLRKSNKFIVLISSYSVDSKWVIFEGTMAYALKQLIIPVKIEEFGKYSAANLPVWVEEQQLFDFLEGTSDYQGRFLRLKQQLGAPLAIQKHLDEMVRHYKASGILLDEVALALIEEHKAKLQFPRGAEELIEKSKRALQDYWTRYETLEKDYRMQKRENRQLSRELQIRSALFVFIYILLAVYLYIVVTFDGGALP